MKVANTYKQLTTKMLDSIIILTFCYLIYGLSSATVVRTTNTGLHTNFLRSNCHFSYVTQTDKHYSKIDR